MCSRHEEDLVSKKYQSDITLDIRLIISKDILNNGSHLKAVF